MRLLSHLYRHRPRSEIVGVQLPRQMSELTVIARILKQYDILCIQTYRSHMLVLVEEVLNHKYDRNFSDLGTP